jgi:hypothetical protein
MILPRNCGTSFAKLTITHERDHQVAIASHINRRHCHLRAAELRQQFPISIDGALPVEAATKFGALELTDVEIDVGFAEPRRQGRGARE